MTAFNELVTLERSPACGATCELRFQMHAWASYDGDAHSKGEVDDHDQSFRPVGLGRTDSRVP